MLDDNQLQQILSLPTDLILDKFKEKRLPQIPDFTTLKEQQLVAKDGIVEYLEADKNYKFQFILLNGYAGTGKSYLSNLITEYIISKRWKVACTAPTNKAVRILRDNAEFESDQVKFITVHKLLNLKIKENTDTGVVTFEQEWGTDGPTIDAFDVIIVDETSMLHDRLFHLIKDAVIRLKGDLKIIFIGDSAQIPPVGNDKAFDKFNTDMKSKNGLCIPFDAECREHYKIGMYELTDIQRQAKGNPIIERSFNLRKSNYVTPVTHLLPNNSGIVAIDKSDKDLIYKVCNIYFNNDYFLKQSTDFMKVIAWRNVTVNAVNNKVRQIIYNCPNPDKIRVGEKLLANSPIFDTFGNSITFNTNDEFEVLELSLAEDVVYANRDIEIRAKYYKAVVLSMEDNSKKTIEIVHEDSEQEYTLLINGLADRANKERDPTVKKWLWKNYFVIKKRLADVSYNYAITTHKCQGSTYNNAMILEWDFYQHFKRSEAMQLNYVATTRPKGLLFIVS